MDPKYSSPSAQPTPEPELPSMMKSLTSQTPAQPGAMGDPQYPSLAAAVAVDQPLPQTFFNLMASGSNTPATVPAGSMALSPAMAQLPDGSGMAHATVGDAPAERAVAPEAAVVPPDETKQPDETSPSEEAVTPDEPAPPEAPAPSGEVKIAEAPALTQVVQVDPVPAASPGGPEPPALLEPPTAPASPPGASASTEETSAPADPEEAVELELLDEEDDEAAIAAPASAGIAPAPRRRPDQQVRLKREEGHVAILLPQGQGQLSTDPAVDFIDSELWQALQQRLSGGEGFGPGKMPVHLYVQNCLLDTRQLQEMAEALDRFDLKLDRIVTSRRQTAVAAAMSGYSADQTSQLPELLGDSGESSPSQTLAEPLYLQKTVRSGAEIRHPGSVIIVGDLNPGSSVIADGDILVWGRLRGVAHAGASGNPRSIIMALKLEPTQLRIAESVALAPASPGGPLAPEVAYVTPEGIRIAPSANFVRPL